MDLTPAALSAAKDAAHQAVDAYIEEAQKQHGALPQGKAPQATTQPPTMPPGPTERPRPPPTTQPQTSPPPPPPSTTDQPAGMSITERAPSPALTRTPTMPAPTDRPPHPSAATAPPEKPPPAQGQEGPLQDSVSKLKQEKLRIKA
eukprot:1154043-Pelagomonas_calceolata.AAC.4